MSSFNPTTKTNEAMQAELANAEHHTVTGIGHWHVLEAPDFVADFVHTFLTNS